MTAPGPESLGRSVVIAPGEDPPEPWGKADRYLIDSELLADLGRLAETVDELQRRYVARDPLVYVLAVDPAALAEPEYTDAPPYQLGAGFSFLRERLTKMVWHNSYDARSDPPVWWWSHKAAVRVGVTVGGSADVVAPDGTPAPRPGPPSTGWGRHLPAGHPWSRRFRVRHRDRSRRRETGRRR